MDNFLAALVPVILIVGLGRFLAWRNVIAREGWRGIERISYFVLFPALIVLALAKAPFENIPWGLAGALIGAQITLGLIGLMASFGKLRHPNPATGSIIQSNVRWNTFIALSLAGGLFGPEGLALVAIAAAAMIPTANLLSVTALTHFAHMAPGVQKNVLRDLGKNPLIIACAIGITLNITGAVPSGMADTTLDLLGRATIALGLLTAGAGVNFAALTSAKFRTLQWSAVRMLGLPLAALGFGVMLNLPPTQLAVAVICTGTPTATNGYILAQQLGGDSTFSANLIALQTLLAAITLPALYALCQMMGALTHL